jgi:hypothetical protein
VFFDILNEHTYANNINLLRGYVIPEVKNYIRTKEDPAAVNAHKIIKRIYKDETIKKPELVKERWFIDIFLIAKKNFTESDKKSIAEIQLAIEEAKIKIYKIYVDDEINYLKNRGIVYVKPKNSTIYHRHSIDIDRLFSRIENDHQHVFYEIYTNNHAMVLTVTVNPSNNEKNITFFDCNKGLYLFNDLAEAKNFIIEFSKYTSEKYQWNIAKIDNPRICVIPFVKVSAFSDKLIDLTPPKDNISLMVLNNIISQRNIIPTNDGAEIKFLLLNQYNNTVTFSIEKKSNIEYENKKIIMSTDQIDIRTIIYLVNKEQDNLFALSHRNLFTRFDKDNIQVYRLPDDFDLSANINDIYDTLPTPAYKVVPDSTTQSYEILSRAPRMNGDNNRNIDFDKWGLPIIQSELITNNSEQNNLYLEYERTIIIQIQSDNILDQVVAGLIAKHPEKTILWQFDIAAKKRRLAYGHHENLLPAGKTRWIVVGHGNYRGNGQVSQFAQLSPKAVVDGLQWLKNDLALKQTPAKIVLMGCELAAGTAKEDFAFNMTQLLNKNALDANIIAYTNDLFIDNHGKRIGYINSESNEFLPARIYKKTYQYHHATDSITINGKPAILSLLHDLQADKVSFERFITDNQPLLTPLFSDLTGELNIDLIKKIAYEQRAYDLFKNAINESDYNDYENFYNKITSEMINNGIDEAPIWKTVNKNYINENKLNFSHQHNDKLNIIIRLTSDKQNLTKAQLYAIFRPENTIIIQYDVKNKQSFIEYGDLSRLTLIGNHSWTILDGNELPLLDPDTLSQSLLALRQKYPLKVPSEIKLVNDNGKRENTAIYDPQYVAVRLCQKLAEKGLNSSVSIYPLKSEFMSSDSELGIFLDDYHDQQKNTFQLDSTTQKLMINGEPPIKAMLLDIVTGKITLAEITAENPAILLSSFADRQGKLNIKKLKQTIYDPLLSIKVNQYFAHGDYHANDARLRWKALFIAEKSLSLNQQSAELSFLVGELQANPYAVRYLSDHSRYLLGQYFSSSNNELDTIYLMQALANPEYIEFIQTQLQEFSGLKIGSEFDGLSLKQALMKSSTWRQRVLDNIVSLTKSAQCSQSEATLSAVSHGYYLDKINANSLGIEQALGALYVIACQQGKQAQFIKILAYQQALLELSSKSELSIQDQQFLTEFDAAISHLQKINYIARIENQSLKNWLMQALDGAYYLQSGEHAFTVVIKRQDNIFQYQLYDPKAGELVISSGKRKQAQKDFFLVFQTYLDKETRYLNENKERKADLMIENINGDYLFDIYELTLDHQAVEKTQVFWQFTPPKLDTNTYLVKINNIEISLPLLIRAGAQIDGQSLSVRHIQSLPDWPERLTFDAAMLSHHLMLLDGSHDDLQFIKLIKSLINQKGQDNLLTTRAQLADVGMVKQQLGYVDRYVKGEVIDAAMWHEMNNTSFKLPRYARIMSKVGYGSQAIGIAQLWILTNRAADQLQDPRLSDEQKVEIRRQLALAYGAAAANFGTDILQPIIFKSVTKITDSTEIAAKFAGRATSVLNALSVGFDIYSAYQSFHQLSTETDPEVRQDLIVNGALAVVSAAVSITVSVALLAGSSAAGPIGIAVGAGLMVGGMIYNGIRAVERIEEKVKLTEWEVFATGISTAFGEQPPASVLNKLQAYNEEEGYQESLLQRIKNQISIFRTEGYGRALYVKERYQMAEVPLFNIRDIESGLCLTTKEQAKVLTLEKLNGSKIQVSAHEQATENYNYLDMSFLAGIIDYKSLDNSFFTYPKYRFTEDQASRITTAYPDKYLAESVVIKNYAPVMSSTSNETFIFDPERKDLDFYLAGKKIESIYSYIEKNTQFIYLTDHEEVKPFQLIEISYYISCQCQERMGVLFLTRPMVMIPLLVLNSIKIDLRSITVIKSLSVAKKMTLSY